MKARWPGTCTVCTRLVSIGQLIAKPPNGHWQHALCLIKTRQSSPLPR